MGRICSFSVTTPGLFQLVLDGTTTANINYDPTNLNTLIQTAADIQTELQKIEPNTTVTYDSSTGLFHVAFSTAETATQRPYITLVPSTLVGTLTATYTYASGESRLNIENYSGLLRGEANGVMYTQFDASPASSSPNGLTSDNVANATRDGQNTIVSAPTRQERH